MTTLTSETLAAIVGVILSLLFAYVPGFATWYNPLPSAHKRLIMAILLCLTAIATFLLGCYGVLATSIPCDRAGALQLAAIFLAALVANQSTYVLAVQK